MLFNKQVSCQDGHSFCKECTSQWQSDHTLRPVYGRVLNGTLIRNCAVEGAISRRVMVCSSTISLPGGCNWTGSTASLENHLLHCDTKVVKCNFKARGCILRSYQHLSSYPNRTQKCPSCGADIPHSDQASHDAICVGKFVPCPNSCGIQVQR